MAKFDLKKKPTVKSITAGVVIGITLMTGFSAVLLGCLVIIKASWLYLLT